MKLTGVGEKPGIQIFFVPTKKYDRILTILKNSIATRFSTLGMQGKAINRESRNGKSIIESLTLISELILYNLAKIPTK